MITANDLLLKMLDYKYLWSSPERKDSKPAKARLAQIEVMLTAFGFGKNIDHFFLGDFINRRGDEMYSELNKIVRAKVTALFPVMEDYIQQNRTHLNWLFNNLLIFRLEIHKLTYPNGGMLEGFVTGLYYSFYLQAKLKELIKDNLTDIDETLCLLIDPQKRSFDETEIGYPQADLEKIDLDWGMENY